MSDVTALHLATMERGKNFRQKIIDRVEEHSERVREYRGFGYLLDNNPSRYSVKRFFSNEIDIYDSEFFKGKMIWRTWKFFAIHEFFGIN